ncbi:MAG: hypothetical protein JWR17_215 [Pseudomonas sp.]|jgi:uncharacterized protein (TIGR02646 family)|uniref:retron system putative HNH endonuclease n=1 Tax=Pseudomonas sp. TaxID=306 RepID=UPI002619DEE4|nr:retron system putative HNH endonuclease [Pseudomonas sp.]MDB6047469.1 hypothetical protein [Pseudomonas sp.]
MKQLIKGTEPASFSQWKNEANVEWTPTYTTLQNPLKKELHDSLLTEQNFSCCYCGREVGLTDSHIEHFRPQSLYVPLALDYQNLHASCIRATTPDTPLHCGHLKDNWFDEVFYISPMEDGCELRFRYLISGEIQASERGDLAASKMIDVLALDIAYLNNRREQAIRGVFDNNFLSEASDEDLGKIIAGLRATGNENKPAFSHVIARYAEQLLAS